MKRLLVVAGLLSALLVPQMALAEPLDSFVNGFNDLANPQEQHVEVTPERDYIEEYEPEVREVETVRTDEEPTLIAQIQNTLKGGMAITVDGRTWQLNEYYYAVPRTVLLIVAPIAVLLVFAWWGIRKAIHMVMAAFRSGKQTV